MEGEKKKLTELDKQIIAEHMERYHYDSKPMPKSSREMDDQVKMITDYLINKK
jgi:hypothetical protein